MHASKAFEKNGIKSLCADLTRDLKPPCRQMFHMPSFIFNLFIIPLQLSNTFQHTYLASLKTTECIH